MKLSDPFVTKTRTNGAALSGELELNVQCELGAMALGLNFVLSGFDEARLLDFLLERKAARDFPEGP